MTLEKEIFLKIISDHLNKRKSCKPSNNLNWRLILHYAQIHQVGGIIYHQVKSFLPEYIKNQFQDHYYTSIDSFAKREHLIKNLNGLLSLNKIDSFIVKGFPVASFYPLPQLRTMGDTDIVVHSADRQRVHEILLNQGYANESCYDDKEWMYHKGKFELELHDSLIYIEAVNLKKHEEFFMDFWPYVHNGILDWNYHFLYLILHLRKHLMNCGVGFRQFMDVAVVAKYNHDLDWVWIEEQLVKLDLIEFSKIVFALNEAWFDIKSPIKIKPIENCFLEFATEQVFNNGVFGFDNVENKDNCAVNNARKSKHAKFSMFFSAFRIAFPSYKDLILVPKYGYLKGKKWLLPFVWIHRIFKGMNKKDFSRNVDVVKSSFVSTETIKKREEYLKLWGLDELD